MTHVTVEYLREQGLSPSFPQRFFAKVNITESCWLWAGYRMGRNGYGQIGRGYRNGMILAHRASWILHFGPIPIGLNVLHDCPDGDCRPCVCPAHLWVGTQQENVDDMFEKERHRSGDHRGEKHGKARLTESQVTEMRQEFIDGLATRPELASKYGMTWENTNDILRGKRWPHILTPEMKYALDRKFMEYGKGQHVNR